MKNTVVVASAVEEAAATFLVEEKTLIKEKVCICRKSIVCIELHPTGKIWGSWNVYILHRMA